MKTRILHIALWLLALAPAAKAQTDDTSVVNALRTEGNYSVFARLVEACGLTERLSLIRDEAYEEAYLTGRISDIPDIRSEGFRTGTIPEHRYYGFTIFAETDALWSQLLGKAASAITPADVQSYLIQQGISEGNTNDQYSSEDNTLYQFVTYHILPQKLAKDKLVIHYNELGYYTVGTEPRLTIAVEEIYTTLGRPRLLKAFESAESEGICLNRFPVLRNGRGQFAPGKENINDYHESGDFQPLRGKSLTDTENEGILVGDPVAAHNGYVYPLPQVLACTENVCRQLQNQRMRFDVGVLLPEMANNDMRRPMTNFAIGHARDKGFPTSRDYPYFDNLYIGDNSNFYYLSGLGSNWMDYEGDEFMGAGRFDITLKLPPVPADGTYELRIAMQSASNSRTIVQMSLGADPENLPFVHTVDMRQAGTTLRTPSGNFQKSIGWEEDTNDPVYNRSVDIRLHERGYMKGANSYSYQSGSSVSLRSSEMCLRGVLWEGMVKAGQQLYLRFENALESDDKQFFFDYIEWCPKEVYDNPETPEDIW